MVQSVNKITKKVNLKQKGSTNKLHENSRNAQKLRRAYIRDDKVTKAAAARARLNKPYLQRVAYFKGAAEAVNSVIELEEIQALINSYLSRHDEELETLKAERRPGRPASSREDLLKQAVDAESKEFESGYWVPDLTSQKCVDLIVDWAGDWTSLGNLSWIRVTRDGRKIESSFPPKGQS